MSTPVTIITGFLGVGKTTAIRHLLATAANSGKNWAVLVNEFGEVGIDGAVLSEGGLDIAEVPGGCICCSAGLALRATLVQLLRRNPDRLLIEPTGLAHPASVIDVLRGPGIKSVVDLRATIALVDPRHVSSERHRESDTWKDQVTAADILVANRCDLADDTAIQQFLDFAHELFPPKVLVSTTTEGELDPAWLDLDPSIKEPQRHAHVHPPPLLALPPTLHVKSPHAAEETTHLTSGWIWPVDAVWDREALMETLQDLMHDHPAIPQGLLRLKGVFRTRRTRMLVNATPEVMRAEGINYRRDSRVELIAADGSTPDWSRVEDLLNEARIN